MMWTPPAGSPLPGQLSRAFQEGRSSRGTLVNWTDARVAPEPSESRMLTVPGSGVLINGGTEISGESCVAEA